MWKMIKFCIENSSKSQKLAKFTMRKMTKKWHKMTKKTQKIWNFQILSDRPDRPIPAIRIGRNVGKSIFDPFPRHGTRISRFRSRSYIFVDCRPIFHLFQNLKIHVWVEISVTVEISTKIFCGKKLMHLFCISCKYLTNRIKTHEDISKRNRFTSYSTSLYV